MKNTGKVAGDDAVLLFATDLVRKVAPRYKLLKAFDKVSLSPGETKKVRLCVFHTWSLSISLFMFIFFFVLFFSTFRSSFFVFFFFNSSSFCSSFFFVSFVRSSIYFSFSLAVVLLFFLVALVFFFCVTPLVNHGSNTNG